jgi:hypothetical protein
MFKLWWTYRYSASAEAFVVVGGHSNEDEAKTFAGAMSHLYPSLGKLTTIEMSFEDVINAAVRARLGAIGELVERILTDGGFDLRPEPAPDAPYPVDPGALVAAAND